MNKNLLWIIGGVVGLALVVLLAFSIAGETDADPEAAFGEVEIEGEPLPVLPEGSAGDPARGLIAPTVLGEDWDGNDVSIEPDGRPKIVLFLAHWCPHCQAEVPEVTAWLEQGGLPDGVDIYSISVLPNQLRGNWPPQQWLENEDWPVPVIADDESASVVQAYGMRGTPFYAVLDGDNTNLGRFSGRVGIQGLEAMVALAQQGP